MNMRDYPTLHLKTHSKGTGILLLFYVSVTLGSSLKSITECDTAAILQLSFTSVHSLPYTEGAVMAVIIL
jgi:hypothetical protein